MYIAYKYTFKYYSHTLEVHAQLFTNGMNDKSLEMAALMWLDGCFCSIFLSLTLYRLHFSPTHNTCGWYLQNPWIL